MRRSVLGVATSKIAEDTLLVSTRDVAVIRTRRYVSVWNWLVSSENGELRLLVFDGSLIFAI